MPRSSYLEPLPNAAPELPASKSKLVGVILLGLLTTPVLYEVTTLSAARWRSLTGPKVTVDTPVLDALARMGRESLSFVTNFAHDRLHDLPWRLSILAAVGAVWVVLGWKILRRP